MSELYTTDILRWTTRIPHLGRLDEPGQTVVKTSRICGSRLTIDIDLSAGKVIKFAQEVKACALGQATAAIVGQNVIGLTKDEFSDIRDRFRKMIAGDEVEFPEKWSDLNLLRPVQNHPGRKGSVMLPFECLSEIFGVS
ncbi:iron-sulfur cluster assembly scaffold protein [Kordiimonas sp. SCSIO 12610]|uniref:iron-sulfur cluster assembly scaffold protein n=1 Tax=Kordiimonas sp. SCSIO 12610 TaxID=2829597 RepID=UPI00210BDCA1|nr:iron-sulfur cluster assembly scaffold protein [Kordiimonas sp. SCSIO 12610]UTW55964.1 iron-sulfur cluster assembly scaffold protein [Kordiimonas sp. SCSIO 12610]